MQTTPEPRGASQPQDPSSFAEAARIADLRLEQWFDARGLELPFEVQAEFTAMAFEAIARERERDPDAVMDELIGELDQRLSHIQSAAPPAESRTRPGWLQRLRNRFASPAHAPDDSGAGRPH